MTTQTPSPSERTGTALLVIDMQVDVLATAHARDVVVENIASLVSAARAVPVPVIWVQHNDDGLVAESAGWRIVPELEPAADEAVIRKTVRDSFQDTSLEAELAARNVGRLIVAGAQTDFCVRWTLHSALTRGYDTVLVADGHTTDAVSPDGMPDGPELIAHINSVWGSQGPAPVSASVAPAAEIAFA